MITKQQHQITRFKDLTSQFAYGAEPLQHLEWVEELVELGNELLKYPPISVSKYSPKELKELCDYYAKCAVDPEYFITTYVRVDTLEGVTSITLRDNQKKALQSFHQNSRTVWKADRQEGKTILGSLYALYYALFYANSKVGVFSPFDGVRRMHYINSCYEHLPKFLKEKRTRVDSNSIEFENGSEIIFGTISTSSIVGRYFDLVYLDEFGLVPNDKTKDFMYAISPSIKSKLIITSTKENQFLSDTISFSQGGFNNFNIVQTHK
jgi:hypothetical protein